MSINIRNHYWIIGGSATNVYSSATNTMVPNTDQTYVNWSTANRVSPIASVTELAQVIQSYGVLPPWLFNATDTFIQPTPTTYTKGQLAAYSANARYNRAGGGITVTSLAPGKTFMTDLQSRDDINRAYDYALSNAGATFQWKLSDGSFVLLNKTQITSLNNNATGFVTACFSCESTTLNSINSGAITTLAAIDAAYAAISNVYP